MKLHTKITLALILGAVAGVAAHLLFSATGQTWLRDALVWIEPFGNAWIRLITMVVVPLVMASLISGTASLGDITKLGRIGGKTVVYYLGTTAVAVTIGLVLSNVIAPGSHMDPTALENLRNTYMSESAGKVQLAQQAPGLKDVILDMIPRNPIQAMASGDMLPIIFFSIFFGAAVSVLPEDRRDPVLGFVDGVNEAAMKMVHWIMLLAPYAVFALIGAVLARFGADVLKSLLVYSVTVLLGLALHLGLTYPAALRFLARVSPT